MSKPTTKQIQKLKCRLCEKEDETQEHVLTKCEKNKQTKHWVPTEDIFTEDSEALRKTAVQIEVILQTINNPPNNQTTHTTTHPTPKTNQQPKATKPKPQPIKRQQN